MTAQACETFEEKGYPSRAWESGLLILLVHLVGYEN
jgi:hypothetical protein